MRLTQSQPSRRRVLFLGLAAALVITWLLITPGRSSAAFPGRNGLIAFTHFDGNFNGNGAIWTMNPDGTGQTQLTASSSGDQQPAWSANGTKLAFFRQTDVSTGPTKNQIFTVNSDGTGLTNVSGASTKDTNPAWSPDGSKIVFRANVAPSGTPDFQIWVMNADGSGRHALTAGPGDGNPAWSPDGSSIAFSSGSASFHNNGQIMVMNADGTNQHPVATGISSNWSPDGSKLVYSTFNGTSNRDELHVINSDGTNDQTVAADANIDFDAPVWSPQGDQIASAAENSFEQIAVMNADGTNRNFVTGDINTGPDVAVKPDWQPATPLFTSAPTITGNAVNGQTLTANAGAASAGTASFQWLRCDAAGNGCVPISGATGTTYKLTTADIGHTIRVRQTVTNAAGSTSSDSGPTKVVAPNPAACSNVFTGTNAVDFISGTVGGDSINGLGGGDHISGGPGRDCINGGSGNDKLTGGTGNDRISGGSGKDKISGGPGNDRISGGSGNDTISAGSGVNVVSGGAGNDTINTVNGKRDRVNCGSGRHDVVHADKKDRLRGCERVIISRPRHH